MLLFTRVEDFVYTLLELLSLCYLCNLFFKEEILEIYNYVGIWTFLSEPVRGCEYTYFCLKCSKHITVIMIRSFYFKLLWVYYYYYYYSIIFATLNFNPITWNQLEHIRMGRRSFHTQKTLTTQLSILCEHQSNTFPEQYTGTLHLYTLAAALPWY